LVLQRPHLPARDAGRLALIWEDFQGHARTYTFDDLRVLSNTIALYLLRLGLEPGERVCLFMDRIPELYIGFIGVLKAGTVAQPLFSAFARTRSGRASTTPGPRRS